MPFFHMFSVATPVPEASSPTITPSREHSPRMYLRKDTTCDRRNAQEAHLAAKLLPVGRPVLLLVRLAEAEPLVGVGLQLIEQVGVAEVGGVHQQGGATKGSVEPWGQEIKCTL